MTPSSSATVAASPTPSANGAPAGEKSDAGRSAAWWWVAGLLALAVGVAVPLVIRARRRGAWKDRLGEARSEVEWFARVLVPQLRASTSREALEAGWRLAGADRLAAVEDELTVLASSAPDEALGARARMLRDAVRSARTTVTTLARTATDETTRRRGLDEVAGELEAALRPADVPSAGHAT